MQGFAEINKEMAGFSSTQDSGSTATLDMDATLISTNKADALFSYKGYKAYQPLNTWWFEQGIILHTEFRDGNVPAGYQQLRVFKSALSCLPEDVKNVRLRSDTAGYQHDLLKYCAAGENSRFGVIDFAIGCNVTREFKQAVAQVLESEWKPIYKTAYGKRYKTGVEWAEVCYVPSAIGCSRNHPEYRYLAKREVLDRQQSLPDMENQLELPFPAMDIENSRYKYSVWLQTSTGMVKK